jgi:hypothetical protein
MLKRIFGSRWDERTGGWKKLHSEELNNLYSLRVELQWSSEGSEIDRVCSTNWKERNWYRLLVGKAEGKRTLWRPRRRWVDNIKIDLREVELGGMDWISLAQNMGCWKTLVNTLMNLQVQWNVGKFLSGCKTGGLSRRALIHLVSRYCSFCFLDFNCH